MKNKCGHVREQLSGWLDGELPEAARAQVAVHLDSCAGCRRELTRLTVLDAALGDLVAPVPPRLAERVLSRLPRRRRSWHSAALAASLILGVVLGGALARDFYPLGAASIGGDTVALEDFHDFPQGSLGSIVVSYQVEEGNGT